VDSGHLSRKAAVADVAEAAANLRRRATTPEPYVPPRSGRGINDPTRSVPPKQMLAARARAITPPPYLPNSPTAATAAPPAVASSGAIHGAAGGSSNNHSSNSSSGGGGVSSSGHISVGNLSVDPSQVLSMLVHMNAMDLQQYACSHHDAVRATHPFNLSLIRALGAVTGPVVAAASGEANLPAAQPHRHSLPSETGGSYARATERGGVGATNGISAVPPLLVSSDRDQPPPSVLAAAGVAVGETVFTTPAAPASSPAAASSAAPTASAGTAPIQRAISVLDRISTGETHKFAVVYIGFGQRTEQEMLANEWGSVSYQRFLRRLGTVEPLSTLGPPLYAGGLDTRTGSDGEWALVWRSGMAGGGAAQPRGVANGGGAQAVFHVTTMMGVGGEEGDGGQGGNGGGGARARSSSMQKKRRHIGNDSVHIVFVGPRPRTKYGEGEGGGGGRGGCGEGREGGDRVDGLNGLDGLEQDEGEDSESPLRSDDPGSILASSITMVRITVEAMHVLGRAQGKRGARRQRRCFYRISVKARPGLPSFGPLSAGLVQVLPEKCAVEAIRQTAINADRACGYRARVQTCWQERLSQLHRVHNRMRLAAAAVDHSYGEQAAGSASSSGGEVADSKGKGWGEPSKGVGKGAWGKGKGAGWS
jgi:hypothetical protein